MSFVWGKGGQPRAEMNVTPMIDVLLVLIIIFMIITPMSQGHFADVTQPQEQGAVDPPKPIVLQLTQTKDDQEPLLSINQQPLAWNDLRNRLLEIYKSRAEHVLFIKGDPDVEFEYIARVIDRAHSADVQRVGLMP